ncbi:Uncharacterised protein [Klebsiella pneumoniae]|uniref:Uncharacterized protein n=1 Tax=Klebsiella pneumoniae TaxID=573 RepID=A0A3S4IUG4_KLEPN|nr:Uncharacterised protein [Klebsiella pneumoniae]
MPPGAPEEKQISVVTTRAIKINSSSPTEKLTGSADRDQVKATAHRGGLHQPQQTAEPAD